MATFVAPDSGLWWYHGPQTATQNLAVVGPQTQTDMILSRILGLDVTIALGYSSGHSDQHSFHGIMALGFQQDQRELPRTLAFPSMVSGTTDINTDPGCGGNTEP